jgi:hypothetical protein
MNGAWMTTHLMALFFYGGPDQIIPLQTGIAAGIALLVMFWNKVVAFFSRLFARKSKPADIAPVDPKAPVKPEQNREQS